MITWLIKIINYLRHFIELVGLLLGVSVLAEILFGPDVAFFGSQVTKTLVGLLNTFCYSVIAALLIVFVVLLTYRKFLIYFPMLSHHYLFTYSTVVPGISMLT